MKQNSLFLLRKTQLFSALLFLGIIFFFSCKKDGELIPQFDKGNLNLIETDTFTIETSLAREDSIRTDIAGFNLLGIYNDPIFGFTSSSIYSQLTLNGLNVDFGAGATLDSAVLTLQYSGMYGDTLSPINVNVFEITTQMDKSINYFSNTFLSHDPTPLVNLSFTPNIKDSVFVLFDSTNRAAHLRINLGATFGNRILAESGGSNLADNATFTQFFKGLYITTVDSVQSSTLPAGQGSIVYFNVNSPLSTVTIYYNDTSSYSFLMNAESVKYSRFDHNYTGTPVEAKLQGLGDTTVAYVQTLAGVKTKIEIPHIKEILKEGDVAVNQAQLIVTVENGSDAVFEAVPTLTLVGIADDETSVFLPDFFEGLNFFGGFIEPLEKTYTFNIPRHLHSMIYNPSKNNGMYLLATGQSITANRTVLGTQKNPTAKLKLKIIYTKL